MFSLICIRRNKMFASAFAVYLILAVSSAAKNDYELVHSHGRCDGMCPRNLLNKFSTFESAFADRTNHLKKYYGSKAGGIDYGSELQAMEHEIFELKSYLSSLLNETRAIADNLEDLADKVKLKSTRIHRGKRSLKDKCGVQEYPTNCRNIKQTDTDLLVYTIQPKGAVEPFLASCNFNTEGGGWTIIQRREDGSVNFTKNYESYRNGFGNLAGEFKIHQMTESSMYELLILLTDFDDVKKDARYAVFKVGSEATGYRLSIGGYSGEAGDSLGNHNNQKFSTQDKDQDAWEGNCAETHSGAWWYKDCTASNLNGQYLNGTYNATKPRYTGAYWNTFRGKTYSLKTIVMMIRPQPCDCSEAS